MNYGLRLDADDLALSMKNKLMHCFIFWRIDVEDVQRSFLSRFGWLVLAILALPITTQFSTVLYDQSFFLSSLFQYTDEEVERAYEEFYEDVHTEFLKFGEIVNFKVPIFGPSLKVR